MGWLRPSHFLLLEYNIKSMGRLFLTALFLVGALFAQEPQPEDLLRHAVELQQAGNLEGAVEGYPDFLALRPNEVAAHSNLGVLLSRLSRYDEAIPTYKKTLHLDPQNPTLVLNLALSYSHS